MAEVLMLPHVTDETPSTAAAVRAWHQVRAAIAEGRGRMARWWCELHRHDNDVVTWWNDAGTARQAVCLRCATCGSRTTGWR